MISRRTLIKSVALGSLGLLPAFAFGAWGTSDHRSPNLHALVQTTPSGKKNRKKNLIVVFLRGGVDGLSIVAPYRDPLYKAARPFLSIPIPLPGAEIQDLDGYFGLHGRLQPLIPQWQDKTLAFIHAAGSPDPTRSHFDAQDYMESGTPGVKGTHSGWLNRLLGYLDVSSPLLAINLGVTTPRIFAGNHPSINISLDALGQNPDTILQHNLDLLYQGERELSKVYQQSQQLKKFIDTDLASLSKVSNDINFHDFSYQAQIIARLIRGQASSQISFVSPEWNWDTHGGQPYTLYEGLYKLGNGLATLIKDLGEVYRDTVIVVLSEFGRSLHENSGGGTDHGRGNIVMVMGGRVKGGQVKGQWPGLEEYNLDAGRDLAVTTDFRDIIGTILLEHLQLNTTAISEIFPGYTFNPVQGLMV